MVSIAPWASAQLEVGPNQPAGNLFTDALMTSGPVRLGYLATSVLDHAIPVIGGSYLGVGYYDSITMQIFEPFQLGQEFTVAANLVGNPSTSHGSWTDYTFRFFEIDGLTPIAVSEVSAAPEPASWSLLGLSLSGVACAARIGRKNARVPPDVFVALGTADNVA